MTQTIIYDFETLGQDPENSVALCLAVLEYNEDDLISDNCPTYEDYLENTRMIKFDVASQITTYHRKIDPNTVKWWSEQGAEAKKLLKPSSEDRSISELSDWLTQFPTRPSKVYTRGNTFDPAFLKSLLLACGKADPFPWWAIRDTRSMIDGMLLGSDIKNTFVPDEYAAKFVAHDPRHDIVMDVMRMKSLMRTILL